MINFSIKQTRTFYLQANSLVRNFRHCSDQVKFRPTLLQTYSTNMFCCQMWLNSTMSSLKKLSTSNNSVQRRFLGKFLIAPIICLYLEEFQHFLSCCENLYRFTQLINRSTNSIEYKFYCICKHFILYLNYSSQVCASFSHLFYCLSFVLIISTYRIVCVILYFVYIYYNIHMDNYLK